MRKEYTPKENPVIADLQEQLKATQDAINYILLSTADTDSAVEDTTTTTTTEAQ